MDAAFTADTPAHSQARRGVVFDVRVSTRKAYQLVRRQQHEYDDAESPHRFSHACLREVSLNRCNEILGGILRHNVGNGSIVHKDAHQGLQHLDLPPPRA